MPPLRKPAPGRRPRRTRAVVLPTDPPPVDPPSPAAGESNPWETAAVRVAYRDGFILCAPGTDPAPLIEALDEHRQPREWAAFGAELAAHGPHRARLAMLVARAVAARGMSPEEEDQLAAWLTRIIVDVIVRVGGVHGVIAWLARTALREERVVATC